MPRWNIPFTSRKPDEPLDPAADDPAMSTTAPGPLVSQEGHESPLDGGPHPAASEMASISWIHASEMRNLAEAGLDPTLFPQGKVAMTQERATAHAYQGIAARTVTYVLSTCTGMVHAVQLAAADVVEHRELLENADDQLLACQEERAFVKAEVDDNDVDRLNATRRRSAKRVFLAAAVVLGIFLLVETFLNGEMFSGAMRFVPYDFVPYAVSLGLMVMLVAVSHLSAILVKDGLRGVARKDRRSPFDTWSAWGRLVLGAALFTLGIVAAFPLAHARAAETTGDPGLWTFLYVLVQLGIHLSVFGHEFLNASTAVSALEVADVQLARHRDLRASAFARLLDSETEFQQAAWQLAELPTLARTLDMQVVEAYRMTIEHGRHLVTVHAPDLAAIMADSPRPAIDGGQRDDVIRMLEEHLASLLGPDAVQMVLGQEPGSVTRIRDWFLHACGELEATYRRPADLLPHRHEALEGQAHPGETTTDAAGPGHAEDDARDSQPAEQGPDGAGDDGAAARREDAPTDNEGQPSAASTDGESVPTTLTPVSKAS